MAFSSYLKSIGFGILTLPLVLTGSSPAQDVDQDTDDTNPAPASNISLSNPLDNQKNMVDRLIRFRGEGGFTEGTLDRASINDEGHVVIEFEAETRGYPKRGSWVSPEFETEFPFTEVLPSWTLNTPEETGVFFEVRTRDTETGEWSPWLYIGQWGRTLHWPKRTVAFEHGEVNVDILALKRPASAFQIAARMVTYDIETHQSPALRSVSVVYSARIDDEKEYETLRRGPVITGEWAVSLPVPFVPQGDNPREISGSTCSPTSTNMVLAYRGVEENLTRTAMAIYDREYGIFGTWNRSVAYASTKGLDGYLTRVREWEDVKAYVAKGYPVIASIKFAKDTFPSNVMESTNGHLIVVRGFTEDGDAIVNDPASRERGHAIVYKADELAQAWFEKGGVAYIIGDAEE